MANTTQILLADQQDLTRFGLLMLLENLDGIEVVGVAKRGQEVMQLLSNHCPDVVVTELQLPDCTGLQLAGEIHEKHFGVKVMILTAYNGREYLREFLQEEVIAGYLLKEDRHEHIVEAIQGVGRGEEGWITPQVTNWIRMLYRSMRDRNLEAIPITKGERRIFELMADGLSNQEIADTIHRSVHTVSSHITSIYSKLQVEGRREFMAWVMQHEKKASQDSGN